jgi:hypothetical protein
MTDEQKLKKLKLRKQNLEFEIELIEDEIKYYSDINIKQELLSMLCLFMDITGKPSELKYMKNKEEAMFYANTNYYPSFLIAN